MRSVRFATGSGPLLTGRSEEDDSVARKLNVAEKLLLVLRGQLWVGHVERDVPDGECDERLGLDSRHGTPRQRPYYSRLILGEVDGKFLGRHCGWVRRTSRTRS